MDEKADRGFKERTEQLQPGVRCLTLRLQEIELQKQDEHAVAAEPCGSANDEELVSSLGESPSSGTDKL